MTCCDRKRHWNAQGVGEVIRARFDDVDYPRVGPRSKACGLSCDDNLIRFRGDSLGAAIRGVHPNPPLVSADVIEMLVGSCFAQG